MCVCDAGECVQLLKEREKREERGEREAEKNLPVVQFDQFFGSILTEAARLVGMQSQHVLVVGEEEGPLWCRRLLEELETRIGRSRHGEDYG